jgi:hypothetical protein
MRKRTILLLLPIVGLLVSAGPLEAVEEKTIAMTSTPPVIDGKLDDEVWASAQKFTDFKTFEPDFGKEPSQRTEAFMTYDSENFYFGVRCYDTEPDKIKAAVSKRDDIFQDDLIGIILDTFNDMQSGFGFLINPLGIQGDGMMGVEGNLEPSHDMVWYSKGQIDELGYTVECRIPLQSIRFPNKKVLPMRLLLFRFLTRTSEQASYPPLDPSNSAIMAQSQPIQVSGLKYVRVVELLPAVTHGSGKDIENGKLSRSDSWTDVSLTGKIGITSDLTLDATINPDYSQVEADAGQIDVNLRYALFYPEKRPFFLEGDDLWQFGGAFEDSPLSAVVHTRTIVNPVYGFKLTGKISPKDTMAAIYARDNLPDDPLDDHPEFTIFRYKHSLKGDSYLGGFYTARNYGRGFNRVAGADGRIRLSGPSVLSFHLFGGFNRGQDEATQNDHALSLGYSYGDRKWMVDVGYQDISPDFNIATGFVTRTGVRRVRAFLMHRFYPKSKIIQRIEPFYWSYHLYDTIDHMWETFNLVTLRFWLPRSTMVRFDGILGNEVFAGERFNRSGYGFQIQTQISKQLFLVGFFRHWGSVFYDPADPFQGKSSMSAVSANYQPMDKLDFTMSLNYSDLFRDSDGEKIYDYILLRSRNTFQVNKYLFLRGIIEYNFYRDRLTVDTLASFTYIPGTVVHVGYGSAFERLEWDGQNYRDSNRFLETKRGFFFKISYLWRL